MSAESWQKGKRPVPDRFQVATGTLVFDRLMTAFIWVGGIGVIVTVFSIFLFIGLQVIPLMRKAEVTLEPKPIHTLERPPRAIGMDEWSELPFAIPAEENVVRFFDVEGDRGEFELDLPFPRDAEITALNYSKTSEEKLEQRADERAREAEQALTATDETLLEDNERRGREGEENRQRLYFGTADSQIGAVDIVFRPYKPVYEPPRSVTLDAISHGLALMGVTHSDESLELTYNPHIKRKRIVFPALEKVGLYPLEGSEGEVVSVAGGIGKETGRLAAIVKTDEGNLEVHVLSLKLNPIFRSLQPEQTQDITTELSAAPVELLVNKRGDTVIVRTEDDQVHFFYAATGALKKRQSFTPFKNETISTMGFLSGDQSLIFTSAPSGLNYTFSLATQVDAGEGNSATQDQRVFALTKQFPALAGADIFSFCIRNRAFVVASGDTLSLRYNTTEKVRWEEQMPFELRDVFIGPRYFSMLLLDANNRMHLAEINDPHPESSWRAFFGKLRYEGENEPQYRWQTTSTEPKFSLVPLVFGSLKGTVYSLFFSVPIALLAALYTACFAPPEIRRLIKPTMEVMASLPSVVLGFIAGLVLAPYLENRVPSALLVVLGLPLGALLVGYFWGFVPLRLRSAVRPGYEWAIMLPFLIIFTILLWRLGPVVESILFTVQTEGGRVGNFQLWWPEFTGTSFRARNSLVVGFVMGFAVIPIIFTITEDSLSNVPSSLSAGSLALGASRWQTALRVVVPVAVSGIFSAVMIGFGRAVGETMIVTMATGNTAIMDWNIFTGFQTLSAAIAIEGPNSAEGTTHQRVLFLGALLLFLFTFVLNTISELLRQRLRSHAQLL